METPENFNELKILLIEDDEPLQSTIRDVLEAHDFRVDVAGNGMAGIEKALSTQPDVIICDVMMPEMNGYQVVQEIRKHAELDLVPFIFLTAKPTYQDMRRGMNLGADDYLVKPFRNQDLIKVIQIRLQKNERLKRAFFRYYQTLEQYVYMNSHDVRSPLSNILGLVQMFDQMPELRDQKWMKMLKESSYQLDNVIRRANDLLGQEIETSPYGDETPF